MRCDLTEQQNLRREPVEVLRRKKAMVEYDRDQAERFARDMDAAEEIPEADSEILHPLICVLILSFIVVSLLMVGTIGYFLWRLFL